MPFPFFFLAKKIRKKWWGWHYEGAGRGYNFFFVFHPTIRPRPNVELFMRRTKLIELSSWKVRRLVRLSLSEWVWIVQHSSAWIRPIERVKIVAGTKEIFFTRLLFGLIQLIGSTRPKFEVWPNRRSQLNLGRPKLEFGSSYQKFDVWPRAIDVSCRQFME